MDPAIQKVEFKVTAKPAEEAAVQALLRRNPVDRVRRKVYFYDTPALALCAKDLFLRARVTEGEKDDSTVKLRPLPLPDIPAAWGGARIELDVVGRKRVPSAKLDGTPKRGEIEKNTPSKLFDEAQEALLPNGTKLDDLAVLGPVDARKWELEPDGFPHKLAVEEWSLPDGTRFFELSFKVDPGEAPAAQRAFKAFLQDLDIKGDPVAKTPRVLKFFADRLQAG
jgi:uncharacterized protein YjbK